MNRLAAAACGLGLAGVALGAFGAHALDGQLTAEARRWWETATLYALVHAAAALAVGWLGRPGLVTWGGWAFVLGAAVFAGTLYAMALGVPRWFGAITPIGGVGLLVGWACVGVAAMRTAR